MRRRRHHPGAGDHPRVRGERQSTSVDGRVHWGPPPRTRGTLPLPRPTGPSAGTTPAYAGNATTRWFWRTRAWDHPRVRGERFISRSTHPSCRGPPPRTRGTRKNRRQSHPLMGTTPAYAGNARPCSRCRCGTRDHPRVRGERSKTHVSTWSTSGPPPRTRGTHLHRIGGHLGVGTTPAYAGNAYAGGARGLSRRDHPRVRGERAVTGRAGVLIWGPPPRTRGTRYVEDDHGGDLGTTPAYAGNAPASVPATRRARDHPRVRGERKTRPSRLRGLMGPPPRTRGTRAAALPPDRPQGTTPAYAGNATARAAGRSGG